jgi:hypothetical protein
MKDDRVQAMRLCKRNGDLKMEKKTRNKYETSCNPLLLLAPKPREGNEELRQRWSFQANGGVSARANGTPTPEISTGSHRRGVGVHATGELRASPRADPCSS